jgi:Domain of unknown function (DUF4062)
MAANVKYQVFVSSTYEDLKQEREQVVKAVLEMGHIPVGMEMFSAADVQQWQIISRHIESSDYYVVIVAHRYGSMEGDRSYTEKEYDYAIERGVPVLAFVIDETVAWPPTKLEKEKKKRDALERFKDKVRTRYISTWTSTADLYGKVSIALTKQMTASPRPGWVRASEAPGPEVLAELARLSKENAELRVQLASTATDDRRETRRAWKEFIDSAAGFTNAKLSLRTLEQRYPGTPAVDNAREAVAHAVDAVDKAILKLELEVGGSDQYGLEKAYSLVDRMNKGQATFMDVSNFAKSLAGTLRAAPTPGSPTPG